MPRREQEKKLLIQNLAKYYLQKWIEILKLSAWQISLQVSEKFKNSGKIKRDYRYLHAKMTLSAGLLPEQVEWIVCHELLHLLIEELPNLLFVLKERLTAQEAELFSNAEEGIVERLTKILIELKGEQNES